MKKTIEKQAAADAGELITVKALKKALENIPDNYPVILSSDEEGNSFGPLLRFGISVGRVKPESPEDRFYEVTAGKPNALILFPA